jgi:hypothetical protein
MFVAIAHASLPRESPDYALVADLDRERRAVGLDHVMSEGQIVGLERCARRWERIENSLAATVWQSQPVLSDRIEQKTFDCMLRLLSFIAGGPGSVEEAREWARSLQEISRAMDTAAAVLESYYRPSEGSAGAPAGAAFEEVAALEGLL